jgi:hypothetical protein
LDFKRISVSISLLAFLGGAAQAQGEAPPLLIHAAHCLAVKGFLPPATSGELTFGYLLDEHSYPGDKVIYIVAFASRGQSNGAVFTAVLTGDRGNEAFNIQNNADFVLSKDEPFGVTFVSPPLGGTWTQEHLASAIRKIQKQPRFTISVKDLTAADSVTCESYTDPQPDHHGR